MGGGDVQAFHLVRVGNWEAEEGGGGHQHFGAESALFPKETASHLRSRATHECILGTSTHVDTLMSNMVVEPNTTAFLSKWVLAGPFLFYLASDFHQTFR